MSFSPAGEKHGRRERGAGEKSLSRRVGIRAKQGRVPGWIDDAKEQALTGSKRCAHAAMDQIGEN
ncbi:hypothetical protein U1839_01475 [Sphingomonas sp. RT2P30]|uniref:hypothetical protein n=1 Tax=Parasphingomonas halimpatiens TaxID=3096162 RepID=UPI002FC71E15